MSSIFCMMALIICSGTLFIWHMYQVSFIGFIHSTFSIYWLSQVSNSTISFIIECTTTFFYTLRYIMTASNVRAKLNKANIPATISVHSTPHFLKALGQQKKEIQNKSFMLWDYCPKWKCFKRGLKIYFCSLTLCPLSLPSAETRDWALDILLEYQGVWANEQ